MRTLLIIALATALAAPAPCQAPIDRHGLSPVESTEAFPELSRFSLTPLWQIREVQLLVVVDEDSRHQLGLRPRDVARFRSELRKSVELHGLEVVDAPLAPALVITYLCAPPVAGVPLRAISTLTQLQEAAVLMRDPSAAAVVLSWHFAQVNLAGVNQIVPSMGEAAGFALAKLAQDIRVATEKNGEVSVRPSTTPDLVRLGVAKTAAGSPLDPVDLEGHVVVLAFYGFNGPSKAELPALILTAKECHDEGLVVLGVNLDPSADSAKLLRDRLSFDWPELADGQRIAAEFGVAATPTFLVFDRMGMLQELRPRGRARDRVVRKLLKQKSP